MESERPSSTINETYKQQQEPEEEDDDDYHNEEEEEEEEENNEILKRRISNHPLYGLLVEAHLDCLKVFKLSLLFPFHFLPSFLLLFTVSCPSFYIINLCTNVLNST